jgi:hypothetical protein
MQMRTYTGEKGITSDRDIPHESTAEDGTERGSTESRVSSVRLSCI